MLSVDIDLIGVPAFVLDVDRSSGVVRFAGVNRTHERVTELETRILVGRTPGECLPRPFAALVEPRYRLCVESRALQEYDEELDVPGGRRWWRTTLTRNLTRAPAK